MITRRYTAQGGVSSCMLALHMEYERFEKIAAEAFANVPQHFARHIENVALLIEDEPTHALREEEGLEDGDTLLGLYRGTPLAARGYEYGVLGTVPDTITLFRLPLLEEAEHLVAEGRVVSFEEGVEHAIRETLWHEIGHYFGLDEEHVRTREKEKTNNFAAFFDYTQAGGATPPPSLPGAMLIRAMRRGARRFSKITSFTPSCMAKTLAIIFGGIFTLVGVLGFVGNPLIGTGAVFVTNGVHNLFHLLIGLVLLGVAFRASAQSARWLTIFGVVYLVLALLGFVMASPLLGVIEFNDADNWLHVVLGALLVFMGRWSYEDATAMNTSSVLMQDDVPKS